MGGRPCPGGGRSHRGGNRWRRGFGGGECYGRGQRPCRARGNRRTGGAGGGETRGHRGERGGGDEDFGRIQFEHRRTPVRSQAVDKFVKACPLIKRSPVPQRGKPLPAIGRSQLGEINPIPQREKRIERASLLVNCRVSIKTRIQIPGLDIQMPPFHPILKTKKQVKSTIQIKPKI